MEYRCPVCRDELLISPDGDEWCRTCQRVYRPADHGWVPPLADDPTEYNRLRDVIAQEKLRRFVVRCRQQNPDVRPSDVAHAIGSPIEDVLRIWRELNATDREVVTE